MDKINRAIIRVLLMYLDNHLSTNQVAKKAEVAPLTARRRLTILEKEGYVESKRGKIRDYERVKSKNIPPQKSPEGVFSLMTNKSVLGNTQNKKRVKSPSKILWTLRYNKKKKK